jgi:unsaturated chondroitin disaccharide hydrolase
MRRRALIASLALLAAGCGSSTATGAGAGAGAALSLAGTRVVPAIRLTQARPQASLALPGSRWAVSFDVAVPPGGALTAGLGGARLTLRRHRVRGWLSEHVEVAGGGAGATVARVDGRSVRLAEARGGTLSFRTAGRGPQRVLALIVSPVADRGALLLHRLAELHARVPLGRYPGGADLGDGIHYDNSWMQGFWPGALWQAAALEPAGGMFARWALAVTERHFGAEHSDTHDVGFMYGESSLAGWRALCSRSRAAGRLAVAARLGTRATCAALRRSVLAAAGELVALARGNPGAGTIPTNSFERPADTIIDSTMNIGILPWATAVTGNPVYARVARRHARAVARLLVRRDGSTWQAVYLDRRTGRVIRRGTHQGLAAGSTWARGESWALYGFAQAGAELHDRALVAVARRAGDYVAGHLPPGGVPRWDYDAPRRAPLDVSAGAIGAAGLLRLATATGPQAGRFTAVARRMLRGVLRHASQTPPLGLLRSQVLNERGSGQGCWCNRGELMFGDTYALEALRLLFSGGR